MDQKQFGSLFFPPKTRYTILKICIARLKTCEADFP